MRALGKRWRQLKVTGRQLKVNCASYEFRGTSYDEGESVTVPFLGLTISVGKKVAPVME